PRGARAPPRPRAKGGCSARGVSHSYREALSAPAVALGLRVYPLEAIAHEPGLPVEGGSLEEGQAAIVDDDLQAVEVVDNVASGADLLGEIVDVIIARAPAALDPHAQAERGLARL